MACLSLILYPMFQTLLTRYRYTWFDLIGLVTLCAVTGMVWSLYHPTDLRRWVALGVLLIFVLLSSIHLSQEHSRREHLRLALLTLLTLALIYLEANLTGVIVLYFILSSEAQIILPRPQALGWMLVWVTIILVVFVLTFERPLAGLLTGGGIVGGMVFMAAATNALRRAETAHAESQRLLAELQTAHQQLQDSAARVEALAISEERNRLAREMHDTLGHRLTVAAVQLEGAAKLVGRDPSKAERMIVTVRQQVLEGLEELRRTVAALRTPLEAELSLPSALTSLVNNFQQATDLSVQLVLPAHLPALSAEQRHAFYRAAQEGLTNVQKHAKARTILLKLSQSTPGWLQMSLEDDGSGLSANRWLHDGSPPTISSFGLHGLRERAEQLGGRVQLSPGKQGGAHLVVELPLQHET
jgi:signal transduction histidine kinase